MTTERDNKTVEQLESIPVGCVPPACQPYVFWVVSGAGVGIPGPMLGVGIPGHTRPSPLGILTTSPCGHTHPRTYPIPSGIPTPGHTHHSCWLHLVVITPDILTPDILMYSPPDKPTSPPPPTSLDVLTPHTPDRPTLCWWSLLETY